MEDVFQKREGLNQQREETQKPRDWTQETGKNA
jgi:hypothetical protein